MRAAGIREEGLVDLYNGERAGGSNGSSCSGGLLCVAAAMLWSPPRPQGASSAALGAGERERRRSMLSLQGSYVATSDFCSRVLEPFAALSS